MNKPEVKVSVITDYICPFCFIGHKRLESLREFYDLKIHWCFVEIHPETPVEGQSTRMFNYSDDHWNTLMDNLQRLAKEEGIQFSPQTSTSNSRKALLMAEACKSLGAEKFYPLHERLFEAFFIDGLNIGDEKVLRDIARQCEIPESLLNQAWAVKHANGPANTVPQALLSYLQYAGAIQARSVPTYIFGEEMLNGAIETDALKQAAEKYLQSKGEK